MPLVLHPPAESDLAGLPGIKLGDYFLGALNAALKEIHYPSSQSFVIWMARNYASCAATFFEDLMKYRQLVWAGAAVETHDTTSLKTGEST